MALTSADIVNEAIALIGANQPPVTGTAPNFDDSTAGIWASKLYALCVAAVARQYSWDFARKAIALTPTGNVPLLFPFEYNYPPNGIQVWALAPQPADLDPNDPLPINYVVANAVVGSAQVRVIQTDQANAWAIYNNNPIEADWDPLFEQAVVRLLGNGLSMAIQGKPDTAVAMLQSGSAFEQLGEMRRD